MCQLTIVDTQSAKVNRIVMNLFLSINSLSDGDGFGIVNSKGVQFKTGTSGIEYLENPDNRKHLDDLLNRNYRGIAHCRLATVKSTVSDENAHPFTAGGLSLMHNGSLTDFQHSAEIEKIFKDANIVKWQTVDTYKAALVIEHYLAKNDNKMTAKVIEDAMKYFNGAFNYIIRLHDPAKPIHIFKGVGRPLEAVILTKDDKHVGFIMNSRLSQLNIILNTIKDIEPSWDYYYLELPHRTHFTYTYGTYQLYVNGKFEYDESKKHNAVQYPLLQGGTATTAKNTGKNTKNTGNVGTQYTTTTSNVPLMAQALLIRRLLATIKMSYAEFDILLNLVFGVGFNSLTSEDCDNVIILLEYFEKHINIDSYFRDLVYGKLDNHLSVVDTLKAYKDSEIGFPYHLNEAKL